MPRPMLDDVELQQVQKVEAEDEQVLAQHGVPALEGDFLQDLGRRVTRIVLTGVMTGTEAGEKLKILREKFQSAVPMPFVSDIATATKVGKVLIEEFGVRELAGKPARFEYELTLREFLPPPSPVIVDPPEPPDPPKPVDPTTGTLVVEVIVEGDPSFDFSKVTLTVEGTKDDGTNLTQTLTTHTGGVWTEENMALGQFTARAVVIDPPPMSGSAPAAAVRAGATTKVTITLRPGTLIATMFVVHFRFDNAFLEPCMREVLAQVAGFADKNKDAKLLVTGNTDEVGSPGDLTASDPYNQSLSERRARAVFSYLTFGTDAAASLKDWNALRQRQAGLPTLGDKWGARQYQYMLQALGFYPGVIDGDHGPLTDDAVRAFRQARGLPPGTIVDETVWPVLITDYLDQIKLPSASIQLLPNAADGCDSGKLKWLGCASQDPVKNVRTAWRPNRRVELLFTKVATLPCQEPQPDTFNLPAPGDVNADWCLKPGSKSNRTCFVVKHLPPGGTPQKDQWTRQPAEPGSITVRGSIKFEDGTPAPNVKYILIAPDGEFMNGEQSNGEGIAGRTKADGTFEYPDNPKGIGIYTLEIQDKLIARLEGEPLSAAKGTVVCKRLDGSSNFNVVVRSLTTLVNPIITLASPVVVVEKPHTNPARQIVTLTTDGPFFRSGTVTLVGTAIHFFDAATNGNEISFNGTDNVFTGARLSAGVQLFAQSDTPSAVLDDVQLTLTLTPGATPIGPPATATMTAVELTLDICQSRTAAGVEPTPLSSADKINPGRSVQAANPANSQERAFLIVRPAQPPAFSGDLVLTPVDNRVQLFAEPDETPAPGQAVLVTPLTVPSSGGKFWAQGLTASSLVRDTGFRLGLLNGEQDGDQVAMTVVQLEVTATASANVAAATFVRFGLWDDAFSPANGTLRNLLAENQNFVGSDTRHFFFRLRDPNRAGTATVRWRTVFANNTNDDTNENLPLLPPAPPPPPGPASREDLTLNETGAGTGTFLSKSVFLVTDNVDAAQPTESGLTVGDVGPRGRAQSNHRIRRMTVDDTHQLDGKVVVEYAPIDAGVRPFTLPTTVFNRTPEERRRMTIHFINVRDRVGGTPILTGARRDQVKLAFQAMYALCGVFVEVNEIVIDPRPSTVGWPARFPGDPLAADPAVEGFQLPSNDLVASASQLDLINFCRTSPAVAFNANELYIIFVGRILDSPLTTPLTSGTLGQAFPDSFVTATAPDLRPRGFVFVGVRGATINTDLHEVTHSTTNLRNTAGGHFYYGVIGPRGPGQFTIGNVDAKNLMFPIALSGLGIADPKRLWDISNPDNPMVNNNITPAIIPSQIQAISGSRFTRNF